MKRLLSIADYALMWASVLSFIFTINTNDCSEIVLGSALVMVFAALSAIRGELFDNKDVPKYVVVNRLISGVGTALVVVVISGSFARCVSKTLNTEADVIYFSLLLVGVIGSLAGPIRGLRH
jgi:hypothetical protein